MGLAQSITSIYTHRPGTFPHFSLSFYAFSLTNLLWNTFRLIFMNLKIYATLEIAANAQCVGGMFYPARIMSHTVY